jgi:histidinol phosphatase-like enzyme
MLIDIAHIEDGHLHDDWSQNQVQSCDQYYFIQKVLHSVLCSCIETFIELIKNQSAIYTNYNTEELCKSIFQLVWQILSTYVCIHNGISKSIDHQIANKTHPDHKCLKFPLKSENVDACLLYKIVMNFFWKIFKPSLDLGIGILFGSLLPNGSPVYLNVCAVTWKCLYIRL